MSILLDPTSERVPAERARAARLVALEGKTVGLLDIAKARGDVFLDRLEERLAERGATVVRFAKPTFTKPAPDALRAEIFENNDFLIEALAD